MNRYANFDIDLLDYEHTDGREFLRARVASSPVGEQRDAEALRRPFPSRLRSRIEKLERRELSFDELILLGEELASLLMPPALREFYKRSLAKLRGDEGLRIRIRPHDNESASLPWEYAYVRRPDVPRGRKGPEGFLALDRKLSIVRYEVMEGASVAIQPMKLHDIRAVALLSEVEDDALAELDLDREELNLRQALEGVGGIDTRFLRPGTNVQLQEMLSEDAQVFHFSGHGVMQGDEAEGTGEGQLVFSGDNHSPDPIDVATLGLALRGKGIRLVVLNACEAAKRDPVSPWTGIAPAMLRQGIPAVVGMQYTIGDSNAIAFSRGFYRALAGGESIDSAVCEGRLGILTRSGGEERDWGVPVLYMRSSASKLFPPPIVPLRRNLALLTASILLLTFWFALHVLPWVADGASDIQKKIGFGAGAVPLLFAVWKMIGTFVSKTAKSQKSSIVERWLRHRRAKGVLISLLAASVLLVSTTSSIYLKDDLNNGETFKVAVQTAAGPAFSPRPELNTSTSSGKLDGGLVFLIPPPGALSFRIDEPAGWKLEESEPFRPMPWRSMQLLSGNFIKQDKPQPPVLRLAPRSTVMQYLPKEIDQRKYELSGQKKSELHVVINGNTYIVPHFHRGVVWLGGSVDRLKRFIAEEKPSDRLASLGECLIGGLSQNQMMEYWGSSDMFMYLETPVIKPGDEVTVFVENARLPFEVKVDLSSEEILDGMINTECL